ncbi:hypothetical protein [Silanimonas sp.]|uniref:hypothetical protein n=1 Tax=Silanimonas sp. TaxID=1929290 RepID=UPI0037CB0AFE
MPPPLIRIILPLRDGRLLLDFVDGERRLLDDDAVASFGLDRMRLYADADTVTAEGWRSTRGERIDAARLHAAAVPITLPAHRHLGLVIGRAQFPGGPGVPPRRIDASVDPVERDIALRIDDVYGKGMAADGYTTESRLDRLASSEPATELLRDAGTHWLIEAAQASADEGERMRAVLRAAWQAGVEGLGRDPVEPPHRPEDVVHSRLDAAGVDHHAPASETPAEPKHGWWAPPDGPALWFETSTLNFDELSVDIATIAKQMQANREQDGVPGAEHVLLLPFASNCKLRMIWFDPETGDALGADEYTLVLRMPEEEDDHFDASDFEYLCRDAGQDVVETEGYDGPKLHFRWEWGGPVTALTWP